MPCPWHPAAQNMKPSIPGVVPAPFGGMVSTKLAAASWSELLKVAQLGWPLISQRLPVSLARCQRWDTGDPGDMLCPAIFERGDCSLLRGTMALA